MLVVDGSVYVSGLLYNTSFTAKYKALIASTNDAFCPTLKSITNSNLPSTVNCVMEIVINGLTFEDIDLAIKNSIQSICKLKIKKDIVAISAGNYGGKLGQYHFHLRKIIKWNLW